MCLHKSHIQQPPHLVLPPPSFIYHKHRSHRTDHRSKITRDNLFLWKDNLQYFSFILAQSQREGGSAQSQIANYFRQTKQYILCICFVFRLHLTTWMGTRYKILTWQHKKGSTNGKKPYSLCTTPTSMHFQILCSITDELQWHKWE